MTKFDTIQKELVDIKLTLLSNTKDLKDHIRRTEILEEEVHLLHDDRIRFKWTIMLLGWIVAATWPIIQLIVDLIHK